MTSPSVPIHQAVKEAFSETVALWTQLARNGRTVLDPEGVEQEIADKLIAELNARGYIIKQR